MARSTEVPAVQATTRNTVLICSKLPTSLVLNHPMDPETKVTIRGLNAAQRGTNGQPIVVPFITTEVDEDFWTCWEAAHGLKTRRPFSAIKNGAIYVAKNAADANAIAREEEKRDTGLQGMSQGLDTRMGKRAQDNVFKDKD